MSEADSLGHGVVFFCEFYDWRTSVPGLLAAAGLGERLREQSQVLIKPNLVENLAPPVTTPVGLVAEIVCFIRSVSSRIRIIIAEGCGALDYDTGDVFAELGYSALVSRQDVELVDLNEAPLIELTNPRCRRWPQMHLPAIVFDSFLISVPMLKAHSLAGVTLTMKNMMGIAPPRFYQQGGHWRKAGFHERIQEAILDLNRYRTPDFSLLDATIGMQEAHLWGPTCDPPPKKLAAGFDPVAIDAFGAELLGRDWRRIGHIREAHGELGTAEPLCIRIESKSGS